ncbi:hypothetical protein N7539_006014 [Penicillium diatomitis]|uniref:ATP-grasp domain-containing protein n=1 Tax=Penicillium diatomitis TaxID=2819901 RepID=A0A9W9X5W7_9EURO|nr:uncharacterized protein N7539_006014 [Penicillium diatomitis]KAJ5483814.1 hypothetical protein N7539_006014 [Penicillium diatomitis]
MTFLSLLTAYRAQFGCDDETPLLKLIVPRRTGFAARSNAFRDRLWNFQSCLSFIDRTEFSQRYEAPKADMPLAVVLNLSVCMLLVCRTRVKQQNCDVASLGQMIAKELQYPWLLDHAPLPKTLVMFNGRKNTEAAKPILETAYDLGIRLVILDHPGHWLIKSPYNHLYHEFIPMDMNFDDDLPHRIVAAVQTCLPVDGLFTVSDPCLVAVAQAALILGLPTEPPAAFAASVDKSQTRAFSAAPAIEDGDDGFQFASAASLAELDGLLTSSQFIPRYPLIVKPSTGWSSENVFKIHNRTELLQAAAGIPSRPASPRILVETYVNGPEVDANFVLLDGRVLFFEASDDFPCAADAVDAGFKADFGEQANLLPSTLPPQELNSIHDTLLHILRAVGFRTGVFHLEARVRDSTMAYTTTEDGVLDLDRKRAGCLDAPRCFLIEINARPPGFQSLYATRVAYGIDYVALHLLAALGDHPRMQALSHATRQMSPFQEETATGQYPLWCQILFIASHDRQGGICETPDACETLLEVHPHLSSHVVMGKSFFRSGDYVPPLSANSRVFLAFFLVVSRTSRVEVLKVGEEIRKYFRLDLQRQT